MSTPNIPKPKTLRTDNTPPEGIPYKAPPDMGLASENPPTQREQTLIKRLEDWRTHYEAEKEAHAATANRLAKRNAELEGTQTRLHTALDRARTLEKKLEHIEASLKSVTGVLADLRVQHRATISSKETLMSVVCAFASKGKRT